MDSRVTDQLKNTLGVSGGQGGGKGVKQKLSASGKSNESVQGLVEGRKKLTLNSGGLQGGDVQSKRDPICLSETYRETPRVLQTG